MAEIRGGEEGGERDGGGGLVAVPTRARGDAQVEEQVQREQLEVWPYEAAEEDDARRRTARVDVRRVRRID